MTETQSAAKPATQPNIFDSAVLLNVSIGLPGNHRKVSMEDVLVDADKSWLSTSKQLIECAEFDAIHKAVGKFKNWILSKCIFPRSDGDRPALRKLLKPGVYLLPLGLVSEVDEAIETFIQVQWQPRIEKFLAAYPEKKEQAKEHLKGKYREEDYHSVDDLRTMFYLDTSYVSVGTPQALEKISKQMLSRERAKQAAQLGDVYAEVRDTLRLGFRDLVSWMVKSLEPAEGGRKKQFRLNSVDRFMNFLTDFSAKNLTGDDDLEPLVKKARDILGGLSAEGLQAAAKSESFRDDLASKFKDVQKGLEPLVAEKPSRLILVEE